LLWFFDPIPYHGLHLWDFTITLIGQAILGRSSLDEWSARRSNIYLSTHNTHNGQRSMFPQELNPTTPPTSGLWPTP